MSLALGGTVRADRPGGAGAAAARGYGGGCLLICGWEDAADAIARRRSPAARMLRRAGALPVGGGAGRAWLAGRYAGPHLRDDLLDRGVLVETLETATTWSNLEALHAAVTRGARGRAGARRSSSATSPTSTRRAPRCTSRRSRRRTATIRSVSGAGRSAPPRRRSSRPAATITHHHAVGADHAPWMPGRGGPLGHDLLRMVKERCDPAGVMNPGKLL